ncbi:MAG TPA: thiamine/thiamine pyrophosphate ABC transporter permease ThiP [Pelagibacterium sp.]|uniref:thiamine/thiamine pyrophosphate ABC transporter permease ThiP n=1 Tax=Pelagibacterium sp. TaxID=1967288 RepID=UPI002CA97E12|nr:thiamine/thiamine pyrophosphate ABC transporter permease ThiP [Pelagibacterium sp.]HWJ86949.1 thiamine/thiamine pyrophosphate ABC transporter permease ThiP [Pelagibacterium sp.]
MAGSSHLWRPGRRLVGAVIAAAIALLIASLLGALWIAGQRFATTGSSVTGIGDLLAMSLVQASLSTLLSILAGIVLAWVLDRLRFPGRALVIGMLSTALVMPALVIVSGLLAIWGRQGWANLVLAPFGLQTGSSIFGLGGILAAHVILNGAFSGRIFLDRLAAIPTDKLKLGRSLGLGPIRRFAIIDLPALGASIPGVAATVFLLCFTSFPIVLTLGGGPANQTFEVAIYQAVRLDFDLGAAVKLALIQLLVCAAIIIPASTLAPASTLFGARGGLHWPEKPWLSAVQSLLLLVLAAGFLAPLAAVLTKGAGAMSGVLVQPGFWRAASTSLVVGTLSALLTVALGTALGMARALQPHGSPLRAVLGFPVFAYLAVPAVVLSLGFFLLARLTGLPPLAVAPGVLILANALLALPFVFATLAPPLEALALRHERVIRTLGLSSLTQWRRIEWPLLGQPIGYALAIAFVFSLGDLGVISLFGTSEFSTLPWLMYRALGAYRTNDADAIAAILLLLSVSAFIFIPKLFDWLTNARNR